MPGYQLDLYIKGGIDTDKLADGGIHRVKVTLGGFDMPSEQTVWTGPWQTGYPEEHEIRDAADRALSALAGLISDRMEG